ncbi:MAG: GNAT family N-acetyltransferase [Chloroflexi bacterium]|nr:GNAT family N-acetyltransferase [Chloroflexota bacterium]
MSTNHARERLVLADALGDTPETVMAVHRLRHGLARAVVAGPLHRPCAVIVQAYSVPEEPAGYGDDPEAIWSLLRDLDGWISIHVALALGPPLATLIAAATGHPRAFTEEIFSVLDQPVTALTHPAVRRLTPADLPLMEAATADLGMDGWRFGSAAALLAEGFAAGAVADDRLVSVAFTSARTGRHAEVGVVTAAPWRGRGFSTSAAALVCAEIQNAGQTVVWSTSEDNVASRRVGDKLGFVEVSRRVYVNPA